jgi:hypothetical protein
LIQEKHIDSRNCLVGVKNCTLIVGQRLFQQHRPKAEIGVLSRIRQRLGDVADTVDETLRQRTQCAVLESDDSDWARPCWQFNRQPRNAFRLPLGSATLASPERGLP